MPKDYTKHGGLYSVDGYINIQKSKLKSKDFIIIVKKLDP